MPTRISHWIDGAVVAGTSGRVGPVFNPATGEQTGEVDLASAAEVDARRRLGRRGGRRVARGVAVAAGGGAVRLPRAAARAHRRAGRGHHQRARQGARRRPGRGGPRPGERRVRHRHPAPAQGRVLRAGLGRGRRLLDPPAARRGRRHHPVQLPGDGAAVDVHDRDRLRQRVHPQAEREGPVGGAVPGPALAGGRPAGRRVHGGQRRPGGGRRDPGPPATSPR